MKDAINKDSAGTELGQHFILSYSFVGSRRYTHERTQDEMTYVKKYGHRNLFINCSCNPKWKEIQSELLEELSYALIGKVLKLKVIKIMILSAKDTLFSSVRCNIYVTLCNIYVTYMYVI